jgi:hypothetical protein
MLPFRKNLPLAATATLTFTLMSSAAHARGGGHHLGTSRPPAIHNADVPLARIGQGAHSTFRYQADPGGAAGLVARSVAPPTGVSGSSGATGSASASSSAAATTITIAPPSAPPDRVTPPSAIAAPMTDIAPVAPLSSQLQTQFATGGVVQPNLALSPGSASPSESAPSAPGGGGKSLADCMGFWDRATHMTKVEWKAACLRTMQTYPSVLH